METDWIQTSHQLINPKEIIALDLQKSSSDGGGELLTIFLRGGGQIEVRSDEAIRIWRRFETFAESQTKPIENKPSLVERCPDCDIRGLKKITVDGSGERRYMKCKHENLKNNTGIDSGGEIDIALTPENKEKAS